MSEKTGSRILYPYKVVGRVCGKQRLCVNTLGTDVFLNVPIGKSFQIYNTDKLRMIMASPQLSEDITAMEVFKEFTFTAVGRDILKWKRFSVVETMKGEFGVIVTVIRMGNYLISASKDGYLCVWNWRNAELIRTINLGKSFNPTVLCHPTTYLNKVLVGSSTGKLQMWNIRSGSLIMSYTGYSSGISFMEQSPTIDVAAIGLESGEIHILNLKFDEDVMRFQQSSCVTGLSFMSNMNKAPLLASSGIDGTVCLWNIKEKRLHFETVNAHEGAIHSVFFMQDSMQFVTAGCDNSIVIWSVDEVDHSPRVLKSRQGHTDSSSLLRFYGYNSVIARDDGGDGLAMNLLSAGLDQAFRTFHVIRDQLSAEMSQGVASKRAKIVEDDKKSKRLPVIVDFAYSEGRSRDWSNVVTCHSNKVKAYAWKYMDRVKTDKVLMPPEELFEVGNYAMCCDVSNSGEMCIIGYRKGDIHVYNLQSGLYRGSLPREAKKGFILKQSMLGVMGTGSQKEGEGRHKDTVLCVGIDMLNQHVVSVSTDQSIHFWDLIERTLLLSLSLPSIPLKATYSRSTGLLAVALQDRSVLLYDGTTHSLIRRFELTGLPTSLVFNESGRWLIASDEQCEMRVFDIPNSRMIDWVRFDHAVLSISISFNDEYIATSHHDTIGIHIWANNWYFNDVMLDSIPLTPVLMNQPRQIVTERVLEEPRLIATGAEVHLSQSVAGGSLQLSHAPHSKWGTLSNIELIKERNKPQEAPKAPEKAPFFLPTTAGLMPEFKEEEEKEGNEGNRFVKRGDVFSVQSELQRLLSECERGSIIVNDEEIEDEEDICLTMGSFYPVLLFFRRSTVSATDAQLNMLCMGPLDPVGTQALQALFEFFRVAVKTQVDFEMVQAVMERTLQLYSDVIRTMSGMKEVLEEISKDEEEGWRRVQGLMQQCLCMVELFSNVQL